MKLVLVTIGLLGLTFAGKQLKFGQKKMENLLELVLARVRF